MFKGAVMEIEKALKNDRLSVSNVSWKFYIPIIYNFAVTYPWNFISKTISLDADVVSL